MKQTVQAADTAAIRALVIKRKRYDLLFAILGMLCLLVGLVTLLALIVDMGIRGVARIDWGFFTSFPSRRAGDAGILSAWIGSALVMLVTAAAAIPIGIAAGVYLEEYARKNWFTDIIEINISNLAGVPSIVYTARAGPVRLPVQSGPKHTFRRPDLGASHPACHHRLDARGDTIDTAGNP